MLLFAICQIEMQIVIEILDPSWNFTVFLWLHDGDFVLPKQFQNLDPSYKMDLPLWDCLGRVKLIL